MTTPDWTTHPDDWPHTPPLEVFLDLLRKDGKGFLWRVATGHLHNLLEEAVEQRDAARVQVERLEKATDLARTVMQTSEQTGMTVATCATLLRDFETWESEALADRDRARTIAVHLEQESAELRAETETVHGVIEQVGLMVENWDYRYVREELQAILDGATFAEVRDG